MIWKVGVDLGWGEEQSEVGNVPLVSNRGWHPDSPFPNDPLVRPHHGLEGVTQSQAEGSTQKPSRGGSPEGTKDPQAQKGSGVAASCGL